MKRHIGIVLLLVLGLLGGCASVYHGMPRAMDIPGHAALMEQADMMPWKMTRVAVMTSKGRAMAVAVYDNAQMSAERTLVLIHGVGADNWMWRLMRGALTDYRVIAVDMPGCGQSDMLDADTLRAPDSSSEVAPLVLQALRAYLAEHPAASPTLVGHSLGGAVILRMYGDAAIHAQYDDVLDPVRSLVLFAPADVTLQQLPAELARVATVSGLEVFLAQAFGALPDITAKAIRNGMAFEQCAHRELVDQKMEVLTDADRRRTMQWMIRTAIPSEHGQIDWGMVEKWVDGYRQVPVPCLLVWGRRDPILDSSLGYAMQREIPHAVLRVVCPGKHSLPLEQPELYAQLLRDFVEGRMDSQEVSLVPAYEPGKNTGDAVAQLGGGIPVGHAVPNE